MKDLEKLFILLQKHMFQLILYKFIEETTKSKHFSPELKEKIILELNWMVVIQIFFQKILDSMDLKANFANSHLKGDC